MEPGTDVIIKNKILFKTTAFFSIAVFLVVAAGGFIFPPSAGAQDVKAIQEVSVGFNPSDINVKVGDIFWVSTVIEDVYKLSGIGLEIKYDPELLECVPVLSDQPLKPGEIFGPAYFPVANKVDAQNGVLSFAALVELPFVNGFSGTGNLVKVQFKAIKKGNASLSIKTCELEPIIEEDKINGVTKEGLIKVQSDGGNGGSSGNNSPIGNNPHDNDAPSQGSETTPQNNGTGNGGVISIPEKALFKDLYNTHWAYPEVKELVEKGIIKGYEDGAFKPGRCVTRQEFAVMVQRIAGGKEAQGSSANYTDKDKIAGWALQSVIDATERGIFKGGAEGKFNPGAAVTRAEITAVLIRLLNKEGEAVSDPGDLKDVGANYWAGKYIILARQLQLVDGYGDGTFKPQQQATRAEVCVMLSRLLKKL
jgi:hypothetical protein